ncbi:MFS transporter [Oryzihumus leptocrescens]|nr:MFS transporter [Oryzihumus leptocrescens]
MTGAGDRRTFIALALQVVVNAFVYSTYLARLPDLRDRAGVDIAVLGRIMTTGNLAALLASVVATRLVARYGSRTVIVWAAPMYVLALPMLGLARSPLALVAAVVMMMSVNVVVDVAVTIQKAVFGFRRGAPVMGRLSAVYSFGTLAGGLAAALMARAHVDVTVHLAVLAVALGGGLVIVRHGLLRDDAIPASERHAGSPGTARGLLAAVLLIGVVSAAIVPLDIVPGEFTTFRFRDDLGLGASAAAAGYFAFTAGMTLGRLLSDHLAVRLGRRRLFTGGVLTSAAGLGAAALLPWVASAYAGFAAAGLGTGALAPLLAEAASRVGREKEGVRAMFLGNRLAGFLTPVLVGSLAGTALTVGDAMACVALPCAVALLVLGRHVLPGRRRGAPERSPEVGHHGVQGAALPGGRRQA